MKSAHPDDAAASGELVVIASGASIELKAIAARLEKAGAKVYRLGASDGAQPPMPGLAVCDLASTGALEQLERYCANLADDVRPALEVVALGSAREELSAAQQALLSRTRQRYPRPLDVQSVSDGILHLLRQPRPSLRPHSQGERAIPSLKPRSSQGPKTSLPAAEGSPSSQPSSSASVLAPDEPGGPRPSAAPVPEHSVVSPELETLLAEAERRVQVQLSVPTEAVGSAPRELEAEHLPDDVWEALAEPLDDDLDNPLPEGPGEDEAPPSSPLVLDGVRPAEPAPGDSTAPPEPWDDEVDEDTGSNIIPDSEQTSGSQNPVTAAANSGAPPTLAPRHAREVAAHGDSSDPPRPEPEAPPTQVPRAPSTIPPGLRRSPEVRSPYVTSAAIPANATERLRGAAEHDPHEHDLHEHEHEHRADEHDRDDHDEREADPDARGTLRPRAEAPRQASGAAQSLHRLELPGALVRGASALVMGSAVRQRFTGCLAFEVDQGLRRVVMKDGDVVIAASAVHGESLVSFLAQRGDISPDTAAQIEHRVPVFGRHAGAALIARGLLEQGDLWPVLRGHAEWVLAQLLGIERGSVQIEYPVPERLAAEPAVFGGATGAEVLVEVIQRAVPPAQALAYLGSESVRLMPSSSFALLSECALSPRQTELVRRAEHVALAELLDEGLDEPMLPCVLYALTVLDVLAAKEMQPRAVKGPRARDAEGPDSIDDAALRAKIQARRALVDEGDYFALLGVSRQATGYDIRRSYVELRRQFDPGQVLRPNTLDLKEDVGTILEVLDEAYEILRDQSRRERYRRAIESMP